MMIKMVKMKAYALILPVLLLSCGGSGFGSPADEHNHDIPPAITAGVNTGEKWQLDEPTRAHMQRISAILRKENIQAGASKAADIRQEMNLLVKDCRMEGAAHEALHRWMEGFIPDLSKAERDPVEESMHTLEKHIQKFWQEFE